LIPGSGVGEAYKASANPAQEVDAIAIYLMAWAVVTFLFLYVPYLPSIVALGTHIFCTFSLASLRKSVGLTVLFFCLTTTFLVLSLGEYLRDLICGLV
jgi:succinate-acetate transporter protein